MLLLRQHGLGQHLEEKYKTFTKTHCILDEQTVRIRNYNGPLTLHQMKGVLYVLVIGFSLATLAFLCEVFVVSTDREQEEA